MPTEPEPTEPAEEPTPAADDFSYEDDWKECVDNTQPGGGGHATAREQEEVLVGYVPFNKAVSAEKWFLGHSWCDSAAPFDLHRSPPARHPRKPHLYAYSFSAVGLGPKSNPDNPNGEPYQQSEWTGPDGFPLWYADYQKALCTIRFRSFGRTRFLGDDYIAAYPTPRYAYEWLRATEITAGPAIQALQADGSSNLKFAEGAPSTAGPSSTALAFPAPLAELLAKTALTVKWLQVPHEYVSDNPYYLYPAKVIGLLGHVNDADFLGNAKGTILFTAVTFEPALQPLIPKDPDEPLTAWDVTFAFEQYDPPKGVDASEYRGHRVYPWAKDGKHYWATRADGSSELLPLGSLYKLFQHIDDES